MTSVNELHLHAPSYTRPWAQISWMILVLAAATAIAAALYEPMVEIFLANHYINGFISGVFVIGVIACFIQAGRLVSAASWAERFAEGREGLSQPPQLLTSMSALLGTSTKRTRLTPNTARVLTDALHGRMAESRDIARYLAGLLIFLGLLGTFWGLARTVPALSETIRALSPAPGESPLAGFGRLQAGFEAQLAAMGTAFASSLLGLAGSLVVGLLELLASHAQSRFLREFEEWVSTAARLDSSVAVPEPMSPDELRALVERNTQHIASLITTLRASPLSNMDSVRQQIKTLEDDLERMDKSGDGDPEHMRAVEQDLQQLRELLATAEGHRGSQPVGAEPA